MSTGRLPVRLAFWFCVGLVLIAAQTVPYGRAADLREVVDESSFPGVIEPDQDSSVDAEPAEGALTVKPASLQPMPMPRPQLEVRPTIADAR